MSNSQSPNQTVILKYPNIFPKDHTKSKFSTEPSLLDTLDPIS